MMATTDKESSAAGTDNRPLMLEESDFDSLKIRIQRYIHGKPNGKLIWNSIKNGPTPHPTTIDTTRKGEQQTQVIRKKRDDEFTEAENIKELADIQAINILTPHAAAAFMANMTGTSTGEGTNNDTDFHSEVCNNLNSPELKIFFEINKLKEQIQGKDNIIGKFKAHINNMKEVSTCPSLCTLENTQLKEELTAVRIKRVLEMKMCQLNNCFWPICYDTQVRSTSKKINKETNSSLPRKETVTVVDLSSVPVNMPTGIKSVLDASKSKSKSDKKIHKNLPARSKNVKRVAKPLRNLNKKNRVDSSLNDKRTGFISKSVSIFKTCNECLVFGNHDDRVVKSVNAKKPKVINNENVKQVWKATGKVFASVGFQWKPTRRKFTLGDTCPLTRITKPEVVFLKFFGSVRTSEPTNNVTVTPRNAISVLVYRHLVLRTANIREYDTSVLEDLKALSWKTCQGGSYNESTRSKVQYTYCNHRSSRNR
nr:hypothetical protein [Tanacetum cinerariifolium]